MIGPVAAGLAHGWLGRFVWLTRSALLSIVAARPNFAFLEVSYGAIRKRKILD